MNLIHELRAFRWKVIGRRRIRKQIVEVQSNQPVCIMIGSGAAIYNGWITTDLPHFDITNKRDWDYFFSRKPIDHLLAEHVLEHLSLAQVETVLTCASNYLKQGGTFRIAVPDGLNPDPVYHDDANPKGKIGSLYGHKSLWDYKSMTRLAETLKFKVDLLEYFKEDGTSYVAKFSTQNGVISRTGNKLPIPIGVSLIVDLTKR